MKMWGSLEAKGVTAVFGPGTNTDHVIEFIRKVIPDGLEPIGELAERALNGDHRSLSRLISRVENGGPDSWSALALIYPRTGRARIIGVTGSLAPWQKHRPSARNRQLSQGKPAKSESGYRRHRPLLRRFRRRGVGRSHSQLRAIYPGDEGVFIRSMGDVRQTGQFGPQCQHY